MKYLCRPIGILFLAAAITTIVIGSHTVDKQRAIVDQQRERFKHDFTAPIPDQKMDLYDGPWLPLEFGCLMAFVACFKLAEKVDEEQKEGKL